MNRPFVLIIEDDPQVAHVTCFILKRAGFDAVAAGSAEEGLHRAFETRPDVVLCDAALPRISGPELVRILKTDAATTHIPVIMMSGNEGIDCPGIFTFLAKPFDTATLVSATRNALASRREPQFV